MTQTLANYPAFEDAMNIVEVAIDPRLGKALRDATPVEVDTRLAAIRVEQQNAMREIGIARAHLVSYANTNVSYRERTDFDGLSIPELVAKARQEAAAYYADSIADLSDKIERARKTIAVLTEESKPLNAEYRRRPWTRAFLVDNTNGHVHKTMDCSTCYYDRYDDATGEFKPGTNFCWLPELSGSDETEIVEQAGERACTVCYPSAPVDVLNKATRLFTPDEKAKAQAKQERDAKRAAKDAAKVVVDGMLGWVNEGSGRHVYPTVRGATNAIAGWLKDLAWYGTSHPSSAEWLNNVARVREVLEAKGVEYDYDKALDAARTKVRREGGTPVF